MKSHWIILGDSFSDQKHSGYAENGVRAWPQLIAETLDVMIHCYASSGDGYVHRRTITFPKQALQAQSDLSFPHDSVSQVIVYGGINDYSMGVSPHEVQLAASSTAEILMHAFPKAQATGFMNWYPHEFDNGAQAFVKAIESGFVQAGMAFRTDSMWILENDTVTDAYLSDNLHPNQHGHALMAHFFSELA